MQMKAAVLREQGRPRPYAVSQPMTIETVDLDPPGPGEVLYKIIGAGLCHSDLSTIENLRPASCRPFRAMKPPASSRKSAPASAT